ncbi:galactokinase [Hoylesella oralis ATCC 33269]|uniref:Galactokinase n=2 Tax=Hoylesella oralis TaxID=28134 RepID=E7RSG7_9BACT|nr:galactokinase [Hoylesella oralis ATCC 33269]
MIILFLNAPNILNINYLNKIIMDIEHVRSRFIKHFDGKTGNIYASPGRINLIGEHTDYNGGFVFPGAVDKGIMAELRPNGTNTVMCYSIDLKDRVEFKVDDPKGPRASWARYIYGIIQEMKKLGVDVKGFNTAFSGDVPLGAGMSSSAALESCFAFALNDLFGDNKVSKWDMVLAGQATEHNYCGVNCGIMDQFASVFGQAGKLMRLDCRSREFEYFPFNPEGYKLVLLDSKVKHELASSAYNDRRKSCENVVAALQRKFTDKKIETLRDADWEMLEAVKGDVSEEDYKRAHYVLGEKDRVLAVCDALNASDYETVGQKMYETHYGLSKEYEVSCAELDYLNELAKESGVTGSRIMGGGFGGCTINLVKNDLYDKFIIDAKNKYAAKFGHAPAVYDVVISDGSRKIC